MSARRLPSARLLRAAGLAVVAGVLVTLALIVDLPGVAELRARFGSTGVTGLLLFSGLYALLTLLPLPLSVVTIAAGAVFGLGRGMAGVVLGATLGAVGAFWIGRVLGRDTVQRLTGKRMATLDDRLRRSGLVAVMGIRLVPVLPFSAVNYLSGLTAVRFWSYAVGTAIGIVPGTGAYVAVGAYGRRPGSWPFLAAVGALAILSLGGVVATRRRRRLSRTPAGDDAAPART